MQLSEQAAATVRIAIMFRRNFCLNQWKAAHALGTRNEFSGTAYWAKQIRKINDAAYEVFGESKDREL